MKLVDVHAHLDHAKFSGDLDEVVARFKAKGGKLIIQNGVNSKTNRIGLEISRRYDVVKCAFGIYPTDALAAEIKQVTGYRSQATGREFEEMDVDDELVWIEEHRRNCVALGEVGMDFAFEGCSEEMKERQRGLFRKILKLAKKIDVPVIVHSRKAEEEVMQILEEEGFGKSGTAPLLDRSAVGPTSSVGKVIMHCFCGKKKLIRRGVENGWFFSVPPAIKRWENFKMLVKEVPLELLLTETDAPYLGDVAMERNESANVVVTLEEIGKIKGVGVEEVGEKIFNNAKVLFQL